MKKLYILLISALVLVSCSDELEGPAVGFFPTHIASVDRGGSVFMELQVSGPVATGIVTISVSNPAGLTTVPAIQNGEITLEFDNTNSATIIVTAGNTYAFSECKFRITSVGGDINGISSADEFTLFVNPISLLNEQFQTGTGSFSTYSVSGAQVWGNVVFGRSGNAVRMSGFSGSSQLNEDWLISPALDFTGWSSGTFSFYSDYAFAGPVIKVFVSTNYSGSGDPTLATWTEKTVALDTNSANNSWTHSGDISLAGQLSATTYVAIVYYSNPTDGSSNWTIDDFKVIAE